MIFVAIGVLVGLAAFLIKWGIQLLTTFRFSATSDGRMHSRKLFFFFFDFHHYSSFLPSHVFSYGYKYDGLDRFGITYRIHGYWRILRGTRVLCSPVIWGKVFFFFESECCV